MAQSLSRSNSIGQAGAGMLSGVFVCYILALILDKFAKLNMRTTCENSSHTVIHPLSR